MIYYVVTKDLDDGNLLHVMVTCPNDGTPNVLDTMLYVDGVLEAVSASLTNPINTASNADVRIGQDFVGRPWNGGIDDAGIFSEALSAEKISAIYSLATDSDLGYDLSESDLLFATFEQGEMGDLNASVEIDGTTWQYVDSGLPVGLTGSSGMFSLGLNPTSGSGLQTLAVPEPAAIAIWTLLGTAMLGFGFVRRRRQ